MAKIIPSILFLLFVENIEGCLWKKTSIKVIVDANRETRPSWSQLADHTPEYNSYPYVLNPQPVVHPVRPSYTAATQPYFSPWYNGYDYPAVKCGYSNPCYPPSSSASSPAPTTQHSIFIFPDYSLTTSKQPTTLPNVPSTTTQNWIPPLQYHPQPDYLSIDSSHDVTKSSVPGNWHHEWKTSDVSGGATQTSLSNPLDHATGYFSVTEPVPQHTVAYPQPTRRATYEVSEPTYESYGVASTSIDHTKIGSNVNPCINHNCLAGEKCVARLIADQGFAAVCTDPCRNVRCAENHVCRSETGGCGTSFCEPVARCRNPCEGNMCPRNATCSLVSLPCNTPACHPVAVPVCGGDPCVHHVCPEGQGCYLKSSCRQRYCQVEPVCRDPCEGVDCPSGTFCYTEKVVCIKAPCNPVPVCRNPCDNVQCEIGEKCLLRMEQCLRGPCRPIAECVPAWQDVVTN